jgi:hypothetical protein
MLGLDQRESALAVDGLADDVDALFLEQAAKACSVDLVVVDQEYAWASCWFRHRCRVYV